MASVLSQATRPKTIKVLVRRKKTASLQIVRIFKVARTVVTYSMSRPSHKTTPYLVPEVILHVPRRNAKVSTTHKYNVGRAMGSAVFVQGKFTMN